jgi:chemotaxis protein MotB
LDIQELLRKDEKLDAEEGAPAWYVSFADMATLLMATFLMLLSFASMDLKKFGKMAGSVQAALGGAAAPAGPAPVPLPVTGPPPAAPPTEQEALAVVQSAFQDLGGAAEVTQGPEGVTVRLEGRVLFVAGDANVRPLAAPALERLAGLLRRYTFDLYILGHTDSAPIETARFPSNWELSGARASAVLRHLVERGASPQRLIAVGLADSRPLAPNDSPEGRARNRRVEFVFKAPEALSGGGFKPARP